MAKKKPDIRPGNYIVIQHLEEDDMLVSEPKFFPDKEAISAYVTLCANLRNDINRFSFIRIVEMFDVKVSTVLDFSEVPPVEIDT